MIFLIKISLIEKEIILIVQSAINIQFILNIKINA
jgi:hypothetical protein